MAKKQIAEYEADVEAALAACRATESPTFEARMALKAARNALSAAIAEGAQPCPDCGLMPHGMRQAVPYARNGMGYEVGCLNCKDHRGARSESRAAAVAAWNEGAEAVAQHKPGLVRMSLWLEGMPGWVAPRQAESPVGEG